MSNRRKRQKLWEKKQYAFDKDMDEIEKKHEESKKRIDDIERMIREKQKLNVNFQKKVGSSEIQVK